MTEHDLNYWLNEHNARFCYSAQNLERILTELRVYEIDGESAIAIITPNGCQLFLPADLPEPEFPMRYQVVDLTGKILLSADGEHFACTHAAWQSRQYPPDATFAVIDTARDPNPVIAMYCNGEDLEVTK